MVYTSSGALHIHSTYSDGTATIEEIAAAAKKASLEWIIITDHNNLKGLKNNQEGWHDGVAVIIGSEISPSDGNHYLALGVKQEISPILSPQDFINQVKKQDGIGFIAHPDENISRKNNFKPLRWIDWNIQGADGIEIWNYLSDWVDNYDSKNAVYSYFFRNNILKGPTPAVLQWWDKLNNETFEIFPAIGGVDAHALNYRFLGINLKIFPYDYAFKTIINQIYLDNKLSESFEEAKQQILDALKYGRNIIINKKLNANQGKFDFHIENKKNQAFPGDKINFDNHAKAVIKLPMEAVIKLWHNGSLIKQHIESELVFSGLTKGKYRVEVYYKGFPWIFTNPILVK